MVKTMVVMMIDYDYDEEEDEVDNNVVGMLRNELEEEVTARASPT